MLREIDDARVRKIVARFSSALEDGDADTFVALLTEDVSWSMPPLPHWYRGVAAVMDHAFRVPLTGCGSWRNVPISANAQPAVACYLWNDDTGAYLAWSINVLNLRDERIGEITSSIRTASRSLGYRCGRPSLDGDSMPAQTGMDSLSE